MPILRASVLLGYKLYIFAYHISKSCNLYTYSCQKLVYPYGHARLVSASRCPVVQPTFPDSIRTYPNCNGLTRVVSGINRVLTMQTYRVVAELTRVLSEFSQVLTGLTRGTFGLTLD